MSIQTRRERFAYESDKALDVITARVKDSGNSFWFMRTNGHTPSSITYVGDFGYLYNQGTAVTCDDAAVLPAITVDLTKANYQKASPVASTDVNN